MKIFIPLLILMSLCITEAVAQQTHGPPTNFDAKPGDRSIKLTWEPPTLFPTGDPVSNYIYRIFPSAGGSAADGEHTITNLDNGTTYRVRVAAIYTEDPPGVLPPVTVATAYKSVRPMLPAPRGFTVTYDEPTTGDSTATLRWTTPLTTAGDVTGYQYSRNGGPWIPTGSTSTTHSVTGLEKGVEYSFSVRAVRGTEVPGLPVHATLEALEAPEKRRRVIQDCPVGWVRSDGFAGRTRRVLLYEVKLQMDIHNPISIYKPDWVAIYVHPDEGLENLDGWKLQVALPYNQHSEYLLTAENAIVVDAGFVEGGFAFIENPEEDPFPMVGVGFTGSPAPGFDYRLYDETGKRVDFGISCYKRGDIFQILKEMEDPRVLRQVLLETLDWDAHYLRSEWTVPTPAPAAPSLVRKDIVGTWADLKRR